MIERLIKPANMVLAGYSYIKASLTGDARIGYMPPVISAELTNNCNLNCPECLSGSGQMSRDNGYMDIGLYNKLIRELNPYLYTVNLYFQGEPMLHPQFFLFLRNIKSTYSVVSTNGHFLSEENSEKIVTSGLKKLIISLDGVDQDTYSSYRTNGSVMTVMEGIRNVSRAKVLHKSSLSIEIQFLVNRLNEFQISRVRQFAGSVKASLRLKSMQIINNKDMESWLPASEKYRRYKKMNGEYVIKSTLPDRCARLWFNPVISWDGKILPCCFDKNAEHVMGNLYNDSFREIWEGTKFRIFRKSILSGRHMIDICRNCTSGLRGVKY